jgi:hypothetical protein
MKRVVFTFALVMGMLTGAAPAWASQPLILALPCGLSSQCSPKGLYKPRLFTPGSHYSLEDAKWMEWDHWAASARVTVFSEFQGATSTQRTTAIFYDPEKMCGVLTFTRWIAGNGDGGTMTRAGSSCFFVIGTP